VVSEPPRPSVVISPWIVYSPLRSSRTDALVPWNPATSTVLPSSRWRSIRVVWTSTMRAFVWLVSVTMPACDPESETAS
jgi:hypothetical protein